MKKLLIVLFILFASILSFAQVQIETEGQIQSKALADSSSRIVYVDTAGIFTVGQQGDKMVLRDSLGNIRFILDANAGLFQGIAGDTVWYQFEITSPARTIERLDDGTFRETWTEDAITFKRIYRLNSIGDTVLISKRQSIYDEIFGNDVTIELYDSSGMNIVSRYKRYFDPYYDTPTESEEQFENGELIFKKTENMYKTIELNYRENIRTERCYEDNSDVLMIGDSSKNRKVLIITRPIDGTKQTYGMSNDIYGVDSSLCQTYTDTATGRTWKSIITPGEYKHVTKTNGPIVELEFGNADPDQTFKWLLEDGVIRNTAKNGSQTIDVNTDPAKSQISYLFSDSLCHYYINSSGDTIKTVITPGEYKMKVDTDDEFFEVDLKCKGVGINLRPETALGGFGAWWQIDAENSELRYLFTDSLCHSYINNSGDTIKALITPVDHKINLDGSIETEDASFRGDVEANGDLSLLCPGDPSGFSTFTWLGNKLLWVTGSGTGTEAIIIDPANDSITINTGKIRINGDLEVSGTKNFAIDHPLDPDNKTLLHACVEGPERFNVYSGNVITDDAGFAAIHLPDYFESLNRDFRYQLTVIGSFAQAIIKEKVRDNRFVVQTNKPGIEVSWQVTGIRNDKYARENPMVVEVNK